MICRQERVYGVTRQAQLVFDDRFDDTDNDLENMPGVNRRNTVAKVQRIGRTPGASHPKTRSRNVAGSTRLRRKLSRIFHREISEMGLAHARPASSGTSASSHPAICQSPRSQRCLRRL